MYKIIGIVILEDLTPLNDPHFDLVEPVIIDYTAEIATISVGYYSGPAEVVPHNERTYDIDISGQASWSRADFVAAMLAEPVHNGWIDV